MGSQDVMELMDRRVKSDGSVLPAAKEIQATEVLMVTPETSANEVPLEPMERREILVGLEDLDLLDQVEKLDQRVSGEVLDHLASLDKKETRVHLEEQDYEENQEEEETTDRKEPKAQTEIKEKRVKWGLRGRGDFQVNQETKERRETAVYQDPEDPQDPQERLEETVPEVTLVMLDQEENLDQVDQKEIQEDPGLVILDREDLRVREERRETVDLAAAEETVGQRASLEIKDLQEKTVSRGLRVNLV